MCPDGDSAAIDPYEGAQHIHVRVADTADASCIARLLFDFNTEFDTPTPSAKELTTRFQTMLRRQDVMVLLVEDSSADHSRAFAYLPLHPPPQRAPPRGADRRQSPQSCNSCWHNPLQSGYVHWTFYHDRYTLDSFARVITLDNRGLDGAARAVREFPSESHEKA